MFEIKPNSQNKLRTRNIMLFMLHLAG